MRAALRPLVGQIGALDEAIDEEIAASVKADETAGRLMTYSRRPGYASDYSSSARSRA